MNVHPGMKVQKRKNLSLDGLANTLEEGKPYEVDCLHPRNSDLLILTNLVIVSKSDMEEYCPHKPSRMTEAEFEKAQNALLRNLPLAFHCTLSSKAWSDGHAHGFEEVISILENLVSAFEIPMHKYTKALQALQYTFNHLKKIRMDQSHPIFVCVKLALKNGLSSRGTTNERMDSAS